MNAPYDLTKIPYDPMNAPYDPIKIPYDPMASSFQLSQYGHKLMLRIATSQ